LINDGRIVGSSDGVYLRAGGTVFNGSAADRAATIKGQIRDQFAPLTVVNYGVITGSISGYTCAVTNEGTISGTVSGRGTLVNGSASNTSALVGGAAYVSGTVLNYGSIAGKTAVGGGALLNLGTVSDVYVLSNSSIINGGLDDLTAIVNGGLRSAFGAGSSIVNFGTIYGVDLDGSDHLVNGAKTDTTALIQGSSVGADLFNATMVNYGGVEGPVEGVVDFNGAIINGVGAHSSALIKGQTGLLQQAGQGQYTTEITNAGTIEGDARKGVGVELEAHGQILNGSTRNHTALIEGYSGVILTTAQRIVNEATIKGEGRTGGFGVQIAGGYLANGAAGYRQDLISGYTGVDVTAGGGTLINFGTIAGGAGGAVVFTSASDMLVVENGCRFIGAVEGGGGTLDLDSGRGSMAGLIGDGAMVVGGIMRPATFSGFGALEVGVYADFKLTGAGSVAAGQAINVAGSLSLGGPMGATVVNAGLIETKGGGALTLSGRIISMGTIAADGGTITVNGRLSGHGLVAIDAATLELKRASSQDITFTGKTGLLVLGDSQGYTGTIAHFSYVGGTALDLLDIAFVGRKQATYSGTVKGGVLTITDGAHTAEIAFTGDYRASQFYASDDGHGGVLIVDPTPSPPPGLQASLASGAPGAVHRLASAAASLGARGAAPLLVGAGPPSREALLAAPRFSLV
jgi:hypothetical protein